MNIRVVIQEGSNHFAPSAHADRKNGDYTSLR